MDREHSCLRPDPLDVIEAPGPGPDDLQRHPPKDETTSSRYRKTQTSMVPKKESDEHPPFEVDRPEAIHGISVLNCGPDVKRIWSAPVRSWELLWEGWAFDCEACDYRANWTFLPSRPRVFACCAVEVTSRWGRFRRQLQERALDRGIAGRRLWKTCGKSVLEAALVGVTFPTACNWRALRTTVSPASEIRILRPRHKMCSENILQGADSDEPLLGSAKHESGDRVFSHLH